ncbi:phosphatidyl serine synthase-domain-containing protein [Entophlyctis helioformis]|nr:phosphatidyl serine synthase-domain-containing protein [Entophlyctis helioformis]
MLSAACKTTTSTMRRSARLQELKKEHNDSDGAERPLYDEDESDVGDSPPALKRTSSSMGVQTIDWSTAHARDQWAYEFHDPVDPTIAFFYKPRNISLLLGFFALVIYVALFKQSTDFATNTKLGLAFPRRSIHPSASAIWRIVLAAGVVYQMILVFILFQTKHDARQLFKFFDPSLGVPLPERNYAENCDLTWEVIWSQADVFVIAHSLGWFCKALILRDYWFCWILSVLFEIMEYSLEHQLPNFAECWWDHHYSWRGVGEIKTVGGKLVRSMGQFTPHSWTRFDWNTTTSFRNFVAVILLLCLELQTELNAFYLKYLLWIPAYQYLTDPNCKRLGMHAWITTANIVTELLIIIKFSEGEFPTPAPTHVVVFWIVFISVLVCYTLWTFALPAMRDYLEKRKLDGKIGGRRSRTGRSVSPAAVSGRRMTTRSKSSSPSPSPLRKRTAAASTAVKSE